MVLFEKSKPPAIIIFLLRQCKAVDTINSGYQNIPAILTAGTSSKDSDVSGTSRKTTGRVKYSFEKEEDETNPNHLCSTGIKNFMIE